MFQIKKSTIACTLLLVSASSAFTPNNLAFQRSSSSSLGVSVVSEFISSQNSQHTTSDAKRLKETFEKETPESVGVKATGIQQQQQQESHHHHQRKNQKHRRHNYAKQETFLKEEPDLDFFTLHSSVVSHLYKDMPINDITRAIKRAQNLHDAHDLKTIGVFLMEECDKHWGYGFRGTLLSRLAVAALHMNEVDLALKAIETRRIHERPSMQPFESAGIVRGLMRAGLKEEGWAVVEDELRLPLAGTDLSCPENQAYIKHRAHALSSIATRYFYQGQPQESQKALQKLAELGGFVAESNIEFEDLNMPWIRLEAAAAECNKKMPNDNSDFREYVWNAMVEFPCPGHEEECPLDSYFLTP